MRFLKSWPHIVNCVSCQVKRNKTNGTQQFTAHIQPKSGKTVNCRIFVRVVSVKSTSCVTGGEYWKCIFPDVFIFSPMDPRLLASHGCLPWDVTL